MNETTSRLEGAMYRGNERPAFEIIDSVTVKLWDRLLTCNSAEEHSILAPSFLICANLREEVAERDGIVWSGNAWHNAQCCTCARLRNREGRQA
jgi:hypothetical protein